MSELMQVGYLRHAELNDATFDLFRELIHRETGITMRESKKVLVTNRVRRRLAALRLPSYEAYYDMLTSARAGAAGEMAHFIDAVSTNETYFFRGDSHFDAMRSLVLPELFSRKQSLRIWSAGCSTGEEPYTLAMVILECAKGKWNGEISITATDINTSVIGRAREGTYAGRTLQRVPREILERYFEPLDAGAWRVIEPVRRRVSFSVHNMLVEQPPGQGFEIIFCRNVMIYFDRETQARLVDGSFASAISKDGYLFIGHAESLIGKSARFRYAQILRSPIYRPMTGGAGNG